jgi:hypothetical protein
MSDDVLLEELNYDAIVLGTSLVPCMLAAALARVGKKVLHLDRAEAVLTKPAVNVPTSTSICVTSVAFGVQYGGNNAALTLKDFITWAENRTISPPIKLAQ